jgi:hypothetical protein
MANCLVFITAFENRTICPVFERSGFQICVV